MDSLRWVAGDHRLEDGRAGLRAAVGLAAAAFLVGTRTEDGGQGHLLGFVSAVEGAQPALARAVSEALTFSGIEAGALDVGFFEAQEPAAAALAIISCPRSEALLVS